MFKYKPREENLF